MRFNSLAVRIVPAAALLTLALALGAASASAEGRSSRGGAVEGRAGAAAMDRDASGASGAEGRGGGSATSAVGGRARAVEDAPRRAAPGRSDTDGDAGAPSRRSGPSRRWIEIAPH